MPLIFLDTNPIIRYLTQDNPDQSARARALFEQAGRGEITLYVSESVVVEAVNVLSSRVTYQLPRQEVARHLGNILALAGFKIPAKQTYLRALDLWVSTPQVRDFVDALSVAHAERLKIPTIASFDTDFDRFPTIKRLQL
jgi:predicted nucleic acid-binding protein